ncbi:HGGxSTG domain-containing protein [Novosphingobium sp.]|uniref:HGGxSTG domain-containing protein n=1 Tax=Novosphingobium sp. TaxID=1874826 RepID=UPI003FA5AAF9
MTTSTPELRKLWRAYHEECNRISRKYRAAQQRYIDSGSPGKHPGQYPCFPAFPSQLRGLACGAKTRSGQPCKRTDLMMNGRCKFHGGMSTGPKTIEGQHQARANLLKRWESIGTPCEDDKS